MHTFEKVFASLPGDGWLTEGEARLLYDEAKDCDGDILEVGCFKGRSTCLLASFGRIVRTVDPFEGFSDSEPWFKIYAAFLNNINARKLKNVRLYRIAIERWKPWPVGFAYLDGDHTAIGTEAQILKAKECGAKVIAIHDVANNGGGRIVRDVALRMLGPWHKKVERMAVWHV